MAMSELENDVLSSVQRSWLQQPRSMQPEYHVSLTFVQGGFCWPEQRLKTRLIKEGRLDPKTLFPPTFGQPAVADQTTADQQPAADHQPAASLTHALYVSATGRVGGDLMAMHQMYSAIVAERNSLRDELIVVMEELERVRGEHEQESENNPPRKRAERGGV